jgi:hypothetical protein
MKRCALLMAVFALLTGVSVTRALAPLHGFGVVYFTPGSAHRLAAAGRHLNSAGGGTALPGQARGAGAAHQDLNDRGTFEIFSAGKNIGTEQFDIRARPNQIEAQGDVDLRIEQNGKTVEVRTSSNLLLDALLDPLSYTWNQKGARSSQLNIDFRVRPARARYRTVTGQDDRRDFKLEKAVVVLDDNALHQYQLALARYDEGKSGTQTFPAFVPQEALPGVITLSFVGPESVTVNGDQRTLRRFLLTTELAQISLWVDDQGRLQMVSAPGAQYEAVRKIR